MMFYLGLFTLALIATIYTGLRAVKWIRTMVAFKKSFIFWIVAVIFTGLYFIGNYIRPSVLSRIVSLSGGVYLGFLLYLFMLTLAADIIVHVIMLTPLGKKPVFSSKTAFRSLGAGILAFSVAVTAYGTINAAAVDKTEYSVVTGSSYGELNIVLISDLHLGTQIGASQIRRVVDTINECDADLVCIAGDVFNAAMEDCIDLDDVITELRRIKSRLGVYAVLGNHDPDPSYEPLCEFFEKSCIKLLDDEYVEFKGFYLVGRADLSASRRYSSGRKPLEEITAGFDENKPMVVIDHQPAGVDEAVEYGASLVLCGHTHNGQLFPATVIAAQTHGAGRCYGKFSEGKTHIIITSGVGYWGVPMRVGSNCEAAVIKTDLAG